MRIQVIQPVSVIGLLFAAFFWRSAASLQLAVNVLVNLAAAVVTAQAVHARNVWVAIPLITDRNPGSLAL
jgi:hypothetical protein